MSDQQPTIETVGVGDARANLSDLINRARYTGQITHIANRGRPIATLVPIEWYKRAKELMDAAEH